MDGTLHMDHPILGNHVPSVGRVYTRTVVL